MNDYRQQPMTLLEACVELMAFMPGEEASIEDAVQSDAQILFARMQNKASEYVGWLIDREMNPPPQAASDPAQEGPAVDGPWYPLTLQTPAGFYISKRVVNGNEVVKNVMVHNGLVYDAVSKIRAEIWGGEVTPVCDPS